MNDKNKIPNEQYFPETGDWSAVSEELAQQLNIDAQHFVKKYPASNVNDLAAKIAARISNEQNSSLQSVSLHVVNEEANETQVTAADSSSEVLQDLNPSGRIVIDRAESLEWLKISAAAMLFLTVTASAIWYSSQLTENETSPITAANGNIRSVPQEPATSLHGSPVIAATTLKSDPAPVDASVRGIVRVEDNPILRNSDIGEVSFDAKVQSPAPKRKVPSEAEMLRIQLSTFEQVIQSMQREIENLRRETSQLQKQISEQKSAANAK